MKSSQKRTSVSCDHQYLTQKVIIVDPVTVTQCKAGDIGEVWVKDACVAEEYQQRTEQSQRSFQVYLADTGEGPFRQTGDLGVLLQDMLVIKGRVEDLLCIGGKNYFPQSIEKTVEQVHTGLRNNCGTAFTVKIKGNERLVIVQEIDHIDLKEFDTKTLISSIVQSVMRDHGLSIYSIALIKSESLPRTLSGKIQRSICRQQFLAGRLAVVDDWCESPQYRQQYQVLKRDLEALLEKVQTTSHQSNTAKGITM